MGPEKHFLEQPYNNLTFLTILIFSFYVRKPKEAHS